MLVAGPANALNALAPAGFKPSSEMLLSFSKKLVSLSPRIGFRSPVIHF
jgi:hypothetical protein